MIKINLLPKELKQEIEQRKTNFSVIGMLILSFIIVGLTCELLFATRKLLASNLESVKEQYQAFEQYFNSDKNKEIEAKVKYVNKLFSDINKIQQEKSSWSEVLIEISSLTPSEIVLNDVKLDKLENKVKITGFAKTREKLLAYEEFLRNFKYLKGINLPSSYLINPVDISFEMTATLNQENLKNK